MQRWRRSASESFVQVPESRSGQILLFLSQSHQREKFFLNVIHLLLIQFVNEREFRVLFGFCPEAFPAIDCWSFSFAC